MCWTINKDKFSENPDKYHKVAEEDIVVYKVGKNKGGKFFPFFVDNFPYIAHNTNEKVKLVLEDMSNFIDGTNIIMKGYHSYVNIDKVYDEIKKMRLFDENIVYGFSVGKFIIPKGVEYYDNNKGEIVSSQLIWTGDIELKF